ncbi:hypothetical protein OIU85_017664 [Salix viminalis]|uniref:Uncharacterized protein n=1 Tax=Salix viminalis TaxID=40686 RepID=A0A9Q0V7W4_SALVM|nr:hypothetical protein OIU85_017664 [Salix viminalis]
MLTVTVAPAKISYLRSLPLWPSNTTTCRFLEACKLHPSSPAASPRRTAAGMASL